MGLFDQFSQKVKEKSGDMKQKSQLAMNEHKLKKVASQDSKHIASLILEKFDIHWLKNMCRYYNAGAPKDTEYNFSTGNNVKKRLTKQDWIDYCLRNISLEQIKQYAKSHKVKIADIEREEKILEEKRVADFNSRKNDILGLDYISEEEIIHDFCAEFYTEVLATINDFQPARNYDLESKYQIELNGFLKSKYPESEVDMEVQVNDSRPDIVIDNQIAIEIKGPTNFVDLESIFGKCHRYQQEFDHMIVTLFDVQVEEQKYENWEAGIKQYFPDVEIIRK